MKKYRLLILITALIFTVIGAVASHATLDATAKLTGPETIREKSSFTVEFKVTCDEIYGMEAKLTETGPITRKSIALNPKLDGWTHENQNGVFMVYSNNLATSFSGDNEALFSVTYELNDDAKVGDTISIAFTDTVLANHNTNEQTDSFSVAYTQTVQKQVSTNTNLLSLKIDGKDLDGFEYTKTEYQLTVPFETNEISVSATCAGDGATYSVSGNTNLKVGSNNVIVKVTAASGATKNYTVRVTRGNPPDMARLTALKAESYALSPAFDPNIFNYTVSVPYTKQSITLTPSANEGIRYSVEGGSKLAVGDNTVTIKVTDSYDNTKTYTVTVTRRKNSNTNLLKLSVSGHTLTPAFDYSITNYSLTVNSSVTSLDISTIAAGDGATVAVTGNELSADGGTVIVTVTAMDGTTKEYTISVIREGANPKPPIVDPPSEDAAKLNSLSIKDLTLTPLFSSSVTAYTLTVPENISSLTITAIGENGSEVIVSGANVLKIGENRVTILVKAPNKTNTEYVITVTRMDKEPTPENAKLQSITLSTGSLSPIFNPNIFSYIVYLPYETNTLTVSATGNENATIEGTGDYSLNPGSNTITLRAVSDDGNAMYTVIAYVMPAFDGSIPSPVPGGNEQSNGGTLSILGNNAVGGKLTVHFDGSANYSVRWLRDGTTVGGKLDYIVTAADMGKTLTVTIYDADGNTLCAKDIVISGTDITQSKGNSGFDAVGMVISLIAAFATLIIGFIIGKTFRKKG